MSILAIGLVISGVLLARLAMVDRKNVAYDSWGHLFLADAILKEKKGPFAPISPRFADMQDFEYPLLVHWLLGKTWGAQMFARPWLVNPVAETVFLALCATLLSFNGLGAWQVAGAIALYAATPLIFSRISIGPNVGAFTTRVYSEYGFQLALLVGMSQGWMGFVPALGLASVLVAVVLLSSKFGSQVVLLVLPLASLFTGDAVFGLSAVLGLGFAVAVSKGRILAKLSQQFAHLKYYWKQLGSSDMPAAQRYSVRSLIYKMSEEGFSIPRFAHNLLARFSWTALALKMPLLWGFLAAWLLGARGGDAPEALAGFQADALGLLLVAGLVFVAVNTKWLTLIGEAERYVVHVLMPACAALALMTVPDAPWILIGVVLLGVAYALLEIVAVRMTGLGRSEEAADAVGELLLRLPDMRVSVWPFHWYPPFRICLETDHVSVFPGWANGPRGPALNAMADHPYIHLHALPEFHSGYGLDLVLAKRADLASKQPLDALPQGWTGWVWPQAPDTVILVHDDTLGALREAAAELRPWVP